MPAGNAGLGNVPNSLLHFGQRYYDPTTGRWTQQDREDRITSAVQEDRYSFAGDDPINESDPRGLELEGASEVFEYGLVAGSCYYAESPPTAALCAGSVYYSATEGHPLKPVEEVYEGLGNGLRELSDVE